MVVWDEGMDADDWPGITSAALSRFVNRARAAAGVAGSVDVLLASDAALKTMNRGYRGKNKATDVLSFPALRSMGDAEAVAGDLAVSLETAARQAADHGHTVATEVRVLLLHGILHLAGYDHETDKGEMRQCEAELRAKLQLPNGLIERTTVNTQYATRKRRTP